MTSDTIISQARLFRFHVPGIETMLAVPIEQMVSVAHLPSVTPITGAPPAVLGAGHWQESPVVLFDLQKVLSPETEAHLLPLLEFHFLIIKVAFNNQLGLIGCPILPGGQMVSVPMSLPRAEIPAGITLEAVHQAVMIGEVPVLLLDTLQIPTLLALPQIAE